MINDLQWNTLAVCDPIVPMDRKVAIWDFVPAISIVHRDKIESYLALNALTPYTAWETMNGLIADTKGDFTQAVYAAADEQGLTEEYTVVLIVEGNWSTSDVGRIVSQALLECVFAIHITGLIRDGE